MNNTNLLISSPLFRLSTHQPWFSQRPVGSSGLSQGMTYRPSGLTKLQLKLMKMESGALNEGLIRTQLTPDRLAVALSVLLTKEVCIILHSFTGRFCVRPFGTDSVVLLIRCCPARSWKYPGTQRRKLMGLNVVGTFARWAAFVPASSIRREDPCTVGGLNACLAVPASNAGSPSSWAQGRANNQSNLFTVRYNLFEYHLWFQIWLLYFYNDFIIDCTFEATRSFHPVFHCRINWYFRILIEGSIIFTKF